MKHEKKLLSCFISNALLEGYETQAMKLHTFGIAAILESGSSRNTELMKNVFKARGKVKTKF